MLKTFKKTLDDGFFPFIILDSINDKVKHFDQFWSAAKTKGFEVSCVNELMSPRNCFLELALPKFFNVPFSRCMWLKLLQTLRHVRREMSMDAHIRIY